MIDTRSTQLRPEVQLRASNIMDITELVYDDADSKGLLENVSSA